MAITAAGVSAAAQLLGAGTGLAGAAGLFGSGDGPDRDFWGRYWRDFNVQQERWKDVTQRSIQHRVADARAAGIHPLFALGASAPSGAGWNLPVPQSGSYGKDVTRRTALAMDAFDRIAVATARKTEAEADVARSAADRAEQNVLVTPLGNQWDIGGQSPASDWEDWYGEAANIPGAVALFRDWMQNIQNRDYAAARRKERELARWRKQGSFTYRDKKGNLRFVDRDHTVK